MSPAPGIPNNAQGWNGQEGIEQPYGAVRRLAQQTAAAPLPKNPALASPKRAQRHAQRHTTAPAPAPIPHPVDTQPLAYEPQLAEVWAQLAAVPGASDLVKSIAAQAAQHGQS